MEVQVAIALFMAAVELILYAGVLSGWSAIIPVLVEEGFFAEGCPKNTSNNSTQDCESQVDALNLVYTISTACAPVLAVGCGIILDRSGLWVTRTLMILIQSLGFLILTIVRPSTSWLLYLSFPLMNIGGAGLGVVNLKICNLYPRGRSTIISCLCGCMSTSVLVFLAVNKIYFHNGVSFSAIFAFFTALSIFFHINTFAFTPRYPAPRELPEGYVFGYKELTACYSPSTNIDHNLSSSKAGFVQKQVGINDSDDTNESSSLSTTLREPTYWTNMGHHCILNFTLVYFVGGFNSWIGTRVDVSKIDLFTTIVNVTLSMGAIFSPVSGIINDFFRRRYATSYTTKTGNMRAASVTLFLADFCTASMLACSLINVEGLQYLTLSMQVFARAFHYSSNATFVSVGFPERHFGVLYSSLSCVAGLVLFLQYPITLATTRFFNNSYLEIYAILLGLTAVASLHPCFLRHRSNKLMKEVSIDNEVEV